MLSLTSREYVMVTYRYWTRKAEPEARFGRGSASSAMAWHTSRQPLEPVRLDRVAG